MGWLGEARTGRGACPAVATTIPDAGRAGNDARQVPRPPVVQSEWLGTAPVARCGRAGPLRVSRRGERDSAEVVRPVRSRLRPLWYVPGEIQRHRSGCKAGVRVLRTDRRIRLD